MDPLDLSSIDTRKGAEQGFAVPIVHPVTRKPIGLTITVLGFDSEAYQEAQDAIFRRAQEVLQRDRRITLTVAEKRANEIEQLAAVTRAWAPEAVKLAPDGEPMTCTPAAAAKLYALFPAIREQVDEAVHNRANFLPASGTGSSPSPSTASA